VQSIEVRWGRLPNPAHHPLAHYLSRTKPSHYWRDVCVTQYVFEAEPIHLGAFYPHVYGVRGAISKARIRPLRYVDNSANASAE